MGRRLGGIAAATLLVGLALAGCGSTDDDGAAGDTASPSTALTEGGTEAVQDSAAAASASTPSDDGAGAGVDDWCPVTKEQVDAVVHHDMVEGQPCTWTAPELSGAVLEVYVTGTDELHLSGSTEAVSGVGDAAAFDVSGALVFERDGAYWVVQILNMGGASDVAPKDAEVELAKLVVDGLG